MRRTVSQRSGSSGDTVVPAPDLIDPGLQTPAEERANFVTHGLGLVLACVGTIVGLDAAVETGSLMRILTTGVFTTALVLVYLASTAFHLVRRLSLRQRWRLVDHAAIYLLIAATYTPVMLVSIGGAWGWGVFVAIWAQAIAGVIAKAFIIGRFDRMERIDTLLYLAMGWTCIVAIGPIVSNLSTAALVWLALGGFWYSAGCIFFLWERLPFNHAIWHVFVLLGSMCHYWLIVGHVVPTGA